MAKKYGDKDYGRGTMKDAKSNVVSRTVKDIKRRSNEKNVKRILRENRRAPKVNM